MDGDCITGLNIVENLILTFWIACKTDYITVLFVSSATSHRADFGSKFRKRPSLTGKSGKAYVTGYFIRQNP